MAVLGFSPQQHSVQVRGLKYNIIRKNVGIRTRDTCLQFEIVIINWDEIDFSPKKKKKNRGKNRGSFLVSLINPFLFTSQLMLLGDSGVGKTCLFLRYRDNTFVSGAFISTVGIDFRVSITFRCTGPICVERNGVFWGGFFLDVSCVHCLRVWGSSFAYFIFWFYESVL